MLRVQRVNNGVLPLVMGVLLHDRSCRFRSRGRMKA